MSEQIQVAGIGLIGVVLGAVISSITQFIQERGKHKRWLIEKKIAYLKDQVEEIDSIKKHTLKDLKDAFAGKKFEDSDNFVSSVPMEVIDVFKRHFPDGITMIQTLSETKKQELLIDAATALEKKKNELKTNIKKLIT